MTLKLTPTEHTIETLLDRYHELTDPTHTNNGGGDGQGVLLMPHTYTPSVRELERLLKQMRTLEPTLYRHIANRYLNCETITRDIQVRRKTKHGKHIEITERRVIKLTRTITNDTTIHHGIQWLNTHWNRPAIGEPMLPNELLVA